MRDEHLPDRILVISAQQGELDQLVRSLPEEYRIVFARTSSEAELQLQAESAVALAEQVVLERWSVGFLDKAWAAQPETLWLLFAATSPGAMFAPAIARGQIYLYLQTPPEPETFRLLVKRIVAHYHLAAAHQKLAAQCQTLQEQNRDSLDKAAQPFIYAEKMVTLGQMVAGIAHEMNTPAGAINAAIGNVAQHLKAFIASFGEFEQQQVQWADLAQLIKIMAAMAAALDRNPRKSSEDVRAEQKRIAAHLSQQNIPNSRKMAKQIARMDIAEHTAELLGLAQKYDLDRMLIFLLHWSHTVNSIKDMKVSIDVLIRIVQALKSYLYPKQEKPELADIHESIAIALTILNNKLKHRIQLSYRQAELPQIWCYASELSHVWMNLLANAIQAIPGAGEIQLETFRTATALGVRITDNGTGIPADIQDRIFAIDFTTKRPGEGSGLGLYLTRQIIEKHGGTIAVTSHPGQTVFEVMLPLALNPPAIPTP